MRFVKPLSNKGKLPFHSLGQQDDRRNESMEDFVGWTRSEAFAEAHANRPPKEMFRGPNALNVHEVFLSTEAG
jgi:hypothetical protein